MQVYLNTIIMYHIKILVMKTYWIILFCLIFLGNGTSFGQDDNCKTCLKFILEYNDYQLKGNSPLVGAYSVSINLPTGFKIDSLTVDYLFSLIRSKNITGLFTIRNTDSTEIKYSLLPYKDTVTVFMQTSTGLWPWDNMRIENNKLIISCDFMYSPPISKIDIEIINLCLDYLMDSSCWQHNDDRNCDDDKKSKTWSLLCALQSAYIEKTGYYNYRGGALQKTRSVINEIYSDRNYAHPLIDFNNDTNTNFADVINILNVVKERIETELKISN